MPARADSLIVQPRIARAAFVSHSSSGGQSIVLALPDREASEGYAQVHALAFTG